MKFMTAASVANLPGYLQDDNNTAKLNDAREITRKAEEEKQAKKERIRELGRAMLAWEDWTPKGALEFAKTYQVMPDEAPLLTQAVNTFKEKLALKTRMDQTGKEISGRYNEDTGTFQDDYISKLPKLETLNTQTPTGETSTSLLNPYSGSVAPTSNISSRPTPVERKGVTDQGGEVSYTVNPFNEQMVSSPRITGLAPTQQVNEVDASGGTTTKFVNPNTSGPIRTGLPPVENVETVDDTGTKQLSKILKQTGAPVANLGRTSLSTEEELRNKIAVAEAGNPGPGIPEENRLWAIEQLKKQPGTVTEDIDYTEAAKEGTGPYAKAKAAIDALIGGFAGTGTIFKDTQDSRQALRLITQLGKSALSNSKRYPVAEQKIVAELFPNPDKFFVSPETESRKFDKLIDILTEERIYNLEALKTATSNQESQELKRSIQDGDRLLNLLSKKQDTQRFKIIKVD